MIRHQAVAENPQAIASAVFAESFQIESPVFVYQEDILAIVAPLGDVVRRDKNFTKIESVKVTLPAELEQLVNEKVERGEFESVDAAVARAVRQTLGPNGSSHDKEPNEARHISDVFAEIMADVPPHELAKLPKDGASQVDHYVYGLPKRDE